MPPKNMHVFRATTILKLLDDGRELSGNQIMRETGFGKSQVIESLGKMITAKQLTRRPGPRNSQLYSVVR